MFAYFPYIREDPTIVAFLHVSVCATLSDENNLVNEIKLTNAPMICQGTLEGATKSL